MTTPRTCPTCGAPVTGARTFCKLSCRIEHDRQQARTPRLLYDEADVLQSELPSEPDVRNARRKRDAIRRLYGKDAT